MRTIVVVPALLALAVGDVYALTQPNGVTIPTPPGCHAGQPTGLAATFACECDVPDVCNIGAPCPAPGQCDDGVNAVCESTMWHDFNDNTCIPSNLSGLDPIAEASVLPETFRPTCALTFTVVTRGTAIFGDAFGWYNVSPTGAPPDPSDLHAMLECDDAAGSTAVLDIVSHPDYAGGEIGFFLLTPESHTAPGSCAGGNCCATLARWTNGEGHVYYSQRAFNPDQAGASSYIHLLVYDSHVTAQKFYFAWEDIFGGSNNDFTDLVTSVEGVECSGGGVSCDTGGVGLCAAGVSACEQGQLVCHPLFDAEPERCNAIDDDCDGVVDDGATCPESDQICDDGRCVEDCAIEHEFDCPPDQICDEASGRCVSPGCQSVTCPPGSVCVGGACVEACDGVVCPHGQTCVGDECIDLCGGVACDPGEVCVQGVCVAGCGTCGGLTCDVGFLCDETSGACLDASCPAGCPAGTWCDDGTCRDLCDGAVCPAGQTCTDGHCLHPGEDPPPGGPDAGPGDPGGGGDDDLVQPTCGGCSTGRPGGGSVAVLLVALAVLGLLRRRR
jgi:MYXO-CTERM domain-containing protein